MIKAKMMKILSAAIVFALLLGNGVALPATAAGEVTVTINAPAEVLAGSNFTAGIDIGNVTNFDAANYDVSFNPSVLRLNNVTAGSIGGTVIPVDVWNEASPGIATIIQNVPGLTGVNGTGSLSMLHFTAIGLPGQTSNVTLSNGILGNTLAQQIPAIWVGDSVNVTGVTKTLTSIIVTPANQSIPLGLLQQFTATGVYSDNSTANLTSTATWTSSNTGVATINSAGQAASLAQGNTNIAAASGNISGSTTLTVTGAMLVSIAVTPVNPSNTVGQTRQFNATGTYTNGSGNITANVTWSSSNVAVATINFSGLASSVATGTTVISATLGSISGSTILTVTSPPLVSIAVTPANPSISRSQKQQFTANGTYSNASTANITGTVAWTSSNTSVATINNAGLASSIGAGSTTITATFGAISGNTILNVTQVTTVEVNSGNTITLNAGGSINATSSSGIAVAVRGLPNLGAPVNGLAGFRFDFSWNKNVINVNSAFKNNAAGWDTILPGTPNNTTGTLTSTGFTTTYSTSDIILVYLGVTAVGSLGDNTTITVAITSLGDKDGTPIPALAVNAPVIIGSPLVAETSITPGLSLTNADVVIVKTNVNRIKNQSDNLTAIIPGGIGNYSATVGGSPGSVIQFLTVNGVSPFNSPSFNSGTGVFSVGSVSSPIQPNNTTLAEVVTILTGDANTSVSLTVAYQIIGAAGQPGLNVPEEHSNTLTFRRGDVKEDVNVDIFDALFIAQYIVGQRPLSGINPLNAASVKHDGTGGDKIDIFDALFIAQYIVGQKNAFYQ